MLCSHKTTILCQFGLFRHKLTIISPSILNHFWWELYHLGADKGRFGKLQRDLQDNFAHGTNQFPTTLTAAYNLLLTTEATFVTASDTDTHEDSGSHGWRQRGIHQNHHSNGGNTPGHKPATGTPGNKQVNPVNPAGLTGLYTSPCFPQGTILLDTGASTSIIRDQEVLTNVAACEPPLSSLTNGGLHSCDYGTSTTVCNSLYLFGTRQIPWETSLHSVTFAASAAS